MSLTDIIFCADCGNELDVRVTVCPFCGSGIRCGKGKGNKKLRALAFIVIALLVLACAFFLIRKL